LNYPDYIYQRWHGTLLTMAVFVFAVIFNIFLGQKLHLVEGSILVLHIVGFFCILTTLWALSPRATTADVWTTFDDPGWGNQGLSSLIGIIASVAPLLGADAAGRFHVQGHMLILC